MYEDDDFDYEQQDLITQEDWLAPALLLLYHCTQSTLSLKTAGQLSLLTLPTKL